ncbi:MAG: mannose-1-phosphate guanylyltransferase/mannose-6-phosphate isomerase [Rhodothalassiaceae bacterium]
MTRPFPVILSGGAGSRLWPLSRRLYPKQLLPLAGERTMIQETVLRMTDPERYAAPVIIGAEMHRFIIAEQLRQIGCTPEALVLEPEGRNTAPAAALAAHRLLKTDPEAILLLLPSDHVITRPAAFHEAVAEALPAARAGHLVTFGIVPSGPETGYGYIQAGEALDGHNAVHGIGRFVEKPDRETAESYLRTGGYYWNSGMFLMRARTFLDELQAHAPDMVAATAEAMDKAATDLDFERPEAEAFRRCPSDSIDYAVMERTQRGALIPVDIGWSDIGSWSALWDIADKDAAGNAVQGRCELHDSRDCLVRSDGLMVAAIGVRDLAIVATKDAVLVTAKSHAQHVKKVVEKLKAEGRYEELHHTRVLRPWGSYETVDLGERFQTKRIVVDPGRKLSLQKHHHRAEHWVVVQGTALVTRDDEQILISENESVYIPLGAVHRLENPGRIALHLVEVQSGSYLGEDDIVRLEDDFNRSERGAFG